MSTNFYCRNSKTDKNGFAAIEVALNIDGKRVFVQLPRKERPEDFQKAIAAKRGNDLKDYLDVMRGTINKAITEIARQGKALTASSLKEYLKNGGYKAYSIQNLFDEHYGIILANKSKDYKRKYEIVRDAFYEVIDKEKEVNAISNATILSFKVKMYDQYEDSTAYGKMYLLKSTIDFALANNKMDSDPFTGIRLEKPKDEIEYLTEDEVKVLEGLAFETDRLAKVRDLFLFQAGSGLAYTDMAHLTPEDIREKDGVYYIDKSRGKTDVEYTAILLPRAMEILRKYNYALPVISNQNVNKYLKEIEDMTELGKHLHSHLARKTYCTHLLNNGVRLELVSKCAGHTNTKITGAIYAHLQRQTIIDEVGKLTK